MSQGFDAKVNEVKFSAGPKKINGFVTNFDYPKKEVRFGFWKYTRTFGRPHNKRTHYEIEIPAYASDGEVDVFLIAKTIGDDNLSKFYLALNNDNLSKEVIDDYTLQTKKIMLDFKAWFYFEKYEELITDLQKDLKKLSRKYRRLSKKEGTKTKRAHVLAEITLLEKQITALRKKQLLLDK